MPFRLTPTLREALREADRPLVGMWVSSCSPLVAEICAGSGLDLLIIDGEHSALTLETLTSLLQAVAAYPVIPVVRVPSNDPVIIKQYLDVGAQNIVVPMVDTPEDADAAVRAAMYPPRGMRGLGSALARSARWNRVTDYLVEAAKHVSVFVQIESMAAVRNAAAIAAVDGVDGVFVGPADLSASMGLIGQQTHPEVVAAVLDTFEAVRQSAGKPVGVNCFDPAQAHAYVGAGASFLFVAADVSLLARGSEALAASWIPKEHTP
jgi:4-hydroxy-2-oxoheptanedioate aldolase